MASWFIWRSLKGTHGVRVTILFEQIDLPAGSRGSTLLLPPTFPIRILRPFHLFPEACVFNTYPEMDRRSNSRGFIGIDLGLEHLRISDRARSRGLSQRGIQWVRHQPIAYLAFAVAGVAQPAKVTRVQYHIGPQGIELNVA